jgi:hypothetical protein
MAPPLAGRIAAIAEQDAVSKLYLARRRSGHDSYMEARYIAGAQTEPPHAAPQALPSALPPANLYARCQREGPRIDVACREL